MRTPTRPIGGSVDLAGLLLKTAAYGLLRFGIPLFPHASLEIAPLAMWLGVIGVVYGAVIAFSQNDLKRLSRIPASATWASSSSASTPAPKQALIGVVIR